MLFLSHLEGGIKMTKQINKNKRQNINTAKLILDIVMAVLFAAVTFGSGLPQFFHEVAGITLGVLFAVHVIINRKMMKKMHINILTGKASGKTKVLYGTDVALIVLFALIMASGIIISQALFTFTVSTGAYAVLSTLHNVLSYTAAGVIAIHAAAHSKYIVTAVKNAFSSDGVQGTKKALARSAALIAAAAVIYTGTYGIYKNGLANAYVQSAAVSTSTVSETTAASSSTTSQSASEETDSVSGTTTTTKASSSDDKNSKSQSTTTTSSDTTAAPAETLTQYLSNLYCTGCHNHCPLSNPRCGRSAAYIQQATEEYNDTYSSSSQA